MLTERKEFGMISLLADGQIQVREDTVIERDGVEISRQYWRRVLDPALSTPENEPLMQEPRIKQLIEIFWTPEVINARKAEIKRIRASMPTGGATPDSGGAIREQGTSEVSVRPSDEPDRGNG